jgi:hypothetical protein
MISSNASQNTNGIKTIISHVSEILNISKKQSQEIIKLITENAELKSIISGIEVKTSPAGKVSRGPVQTSSVSQVDIEFREKLKTYYNRSIRQNKYTHLTEELLIGIWEMDA